ncbi:MAG TPA: phenylalanine--tRNA ligase subunit beta [Thermoplasmatales archaeon]|nr:phenylalanine--tRNA ligase subunit beta [Thermoplasmatales archaeon]
MPVVTFDYHDFLQILGYELNKEEFLDKIPLLGSEIERVEGDEISIEVFPNRPDLTSVEGLARASRAFFGFEKGLKKYFLEKSDVVTNVESSVSKVRPFIATALVKNVTMSDELISSLMGLQEKLHFGLGRERRKVAIGVHDFDQVKPPFTYKAVDPKSVRFVPLGETKEMDLDEILRSHPKGVDYGYLLQGKRVYPLLVDSEDNVLSFPPIINGVLTEVTPFTRNVFLDVTGTDRSAIYTALIIVALALVERGGELYSTVVKENSNEVISPNLTPSRRKVSLSYVEHVLGVKLSEEEVEESLRRMGYDTQVLDENVEVYVPPWRADILHEIDLVEDVAIGYGFDRFQEDSPKAMTYGKPLKVFRLCENARMSMIGLGFNEVTTLSLSNERDEFKRLGLKKEGVVELENPIGEDYTCLRVHLLPSLLKIGRENRRHPLPQRIFEVNHVTDLDAGNETHVAALMMDAKANFTACKSVVEGFTRNMGIKVSFVRENHPAFVKGRCAAVLYEGEKLGVFGELHPATLTAFELEHPATAFELNLEKLLV